MKQKLPEKLQPAGQAENTFLGEEKIGRLMRKFTLPCVISLLVGALYNIVDQIFIANAPSLGPNGNAANTVVFPLTVVALAIATMIGDGCCAYVSLHLGAGERKNATKAVGNALLLIVTSGLLLAAVYLLFAEPLLKAFGGTVNPETFQLSKEYFFLMSLGIPFYMFGQALNPIIRSDGSPRFAMIPLLAGALCNCILDSLFIFVFRWGMTGAALATVLGQILSAVFAFVYLFRMKTVRPEKSSFAPEGRLIGRILTLGTSSFLSQISIVFSMAAVLNMCRKYGAMDRIFGQEEYAQIPTAVIGIVLKFFQIVMAIAVGLSAGCISLVGYNAGAGKYNRVKELLHKMLLAEVLVGLLATLIFELFPKPLIHIFGASNESSYYMEFALKSMWILLCATTLSCVNKGIFIFLQALGKAGFSTLLSTLREIVFGVGLPLLLPLFFGLDGILYFMAAADILTFLAAVPFLRHTERSLKER